VPRLPDPRGAASGALLAALRRSPDDGIGELPAPDDAEDRDLTLYCCYELHYRGFDGVDADWEWDASLLAARARLERDFEADLLDLVGAPEPGPEPGEVDAALRELIAADEAPSLSRHVEREAARDQALEFVIHRSAYQLKEADPHSWAIPRLSGRAKAALVEIQADEYGGGREEQMHAVLFARTMEALGLDSSYGAYLDRIPAVTLATVNLMSLLGLHRRLRGALAGHLAVFEMTSSIPNRRYASGFRRLGYGDDATRFFDVHVTADAVHESIAAADLAGGLARQEPDLAGDILWGARALLAVEGRWAGHVMSAWAAGESSLRSAGVLA
jgi:hypothetical protein